MKCPQPTMTEKEGEELGQAGGREKGEEGAEEEGGAEGEAEGEEGVGKVSASLTKIQGLKMKKTRAIEVLTGMAGERQEKEAVKARLTQK